MLVKYLIKVINNKTSKKNQFKYEIRQYLNDILNMHRSEQHFIIINGEGEKSCALYKMQCTSSNSACGLCKLKITSYNFSSHLIIN